MQEALFELFKTFEHLGRLGQALIVSPQANLVAHRHEPDLKSEDESPDIGFSPAEIERMRQADLAHSEAEAAAFEAIQKGFKQQGVDLLNQLRPSDGGLMRDPSDVFANEG